MDKKALLIQLADQAETVEFDVVMAVITESYDYTATTFSNGLAEYRLVNEAGTNEGSCRIFAFAQINQLSEQQTLACFGKYYRQDVLQHPEASDHGNIRNFMKFGWQGISFEGEALQAK